MRSFIVVLLAAALLVVAGSCVRSLKTVTAYTDVEVTADVPIEDKGNHKPVMLELQDVDSANVERLLGKIKQHVKHGDQKVTIRINSDGGSVYAGFDFIQAVEEYKKNGVKFVCVVDHRAISMGFVILQAVCDERLATNRSLFLAHNGRIGSEGGVKEDLEEQMLLLQAINDSLSQICADRLGMPVEEYRRKLHDKKSWVFGSEEALKNNVIDGIVSPMLLPHLEE
jgi:ATP-dependent protease ClpP protease subunit